MLIIEESSVAKGIRRITALTGQEAIHAKQRAFDFAVKVDSIAQRLSQRNDYAAINNIASTLRYYFYGYIL